jgi:hypothetical protein
MKLQSLQRPASRAYRLERIRLRACLAQGHRQQEAPRRQLFSGLRLVHVDLAEPHTRCSSPDQGGGNDQPCARFSSNQVFAVKLILAIFGILSASAAQAQNAPWCLQTSSDGSLHCTYATFQQCLADRAGGSDFCIQNSTYQPSSPSIRRR